MSKKYGIFKTVFKSAHLQNDISVDDVPVGNASKVTTLFADQTPYEFVNQILLGEKHKASEGWNDVTLTQAWAKSFADKVNANLGPIYLQGHEDAQNGAMRQIPAGYIVGAKLDESYEDGAGRLLLRNRLYAKGKFSQEIIEQTLNEVNAGVLNTSTGDYQRREYRYDEQTDTIESFAIESVKNQTNAIVEYDMNASDASIITSNFKYVPCDEQGNEIGKPIDCTSIRGDFKDEQGDKGMTKEELLAQVKAMNKAGTCTSEEIATAIGINITDAKMKAIEEVEAMLGDVTIKEFVTTALKSRKDESAAKFATTVDTKLKAVFTDELEYEVATSMFKLTEGDDATVDAEIAVLKTHKALVGMRNRALEAMNHTPSGFVGDDDTNKSQNSGMMEA